MARTSIAFEKMDVSQLVQAKSALESVLRRKIAVERQELEKKLGELSSLENGRAARPRRVTKRAVTAKKEHPLKGRKAAPKYRGPNGETWTGRGLPPRWLAELENKGKKRASFLIK